MTAEVGELLHELAQRAPQRLLHPRIGLALRTGIGRCRTGVAALLRMIQQPALPRDQVLHDALLALAALALAVRLLAVLTLCARVAKLIQHPLQLRHLLLGVGHTAFFRRLFRLFSLPLDVAVGELHRLWIERHDVVVALSLIQQRLHVPLDRLAQFLQLLRQIPAVLVVRLLCGLVHRIACRLAGFLQRPSALFGLTLLHVQRELPHHILRFRHRAVGMVAHQIVVRGAQVEEGSQVAAEQFRVLHQSVERR